jgi:hypothetical protein
LRIDVDDERLGNECEKREGERERERKRKRGEEGMGKRMLVAKGHSEVGWHRLGLCKASCLQRDRLTRGFANWRMAVEKIRMAVECR